MFSSSREWHHNEDGDFGHISTHNMGSRDVDICRPDTDNSASCCGCVRKGAYPCEYQEIGGEPPPSITNCFKDPSDWDNDGTVCLNKDSEGCCPKPDFSDENTDILSDGSKIYKQQWSGRTKNHVDNLDEKINFWKSSERESESKGTCFPSTEGGICKYTTSNGTSLFYNYVDGGYQEVVDNNGTKNINPTSTNEMRNEGKNVNKLLNYPMLNAEKEGSNPPPYINLCDRNNWIQANTFFDQMTTQAGRDYYIDDYRERRRRQRISSIGRMEQEYDAELGRYVTGDNSLSASDLLGNNSVRDRFGSELLSPFGGGRGSFFDESHFRPQWDREEEDESIDIRSGSTPSLEDIERSVLYGFIVPEGSRGGDRVKVRIPNGTLVQFTIPENASVGMRIKFRVNE